MDTCLSNEDAAESLLQLPDPCLVAVLRCCGDLASICSAARTHSRLHQAAVEAFNSISLSTDNQHRLDSLLLYKHGQQVISISLRGGLAVTLRQLLPNLSELGSLEIGSMSLQLQPGGGHPGVLGAPLPLKQMRLNSCRLLDGNEGLAAALLLLPGLEHLSISCCFSSNRQGQQKLTISGDIVSQLQQLTYLEIAGVYLGGPFGGTDENLQHLSALTRLVDLQLKPANHFCSITVSAQLGPQQLTRLVLAGCMQVDPAALAGRTLLQHFDMECPRVLNNAAGQAALLLQVEQLQQLTYLRLAGISVNDTLCPPAAAFSALTTITKLQHLDISDSCLPAGVWQHMLPAGGRLPHLQHLNISDVQHPEGRATAPDGTRLVSCCPELQSLDLRGLQYSRGLLAGLQGLSSLTALHLQPTCDSEEPMEGVCQLTGLRQLFLQDLGTGGRPFRMLRALRGGPSASERLSDAAEGLLLLLTQLRQLTSLRFEGRASDAFDKAWITFQSKEDCDEPVWRQVQRHLEHMAE